jgi:hypothetical protein
VTRNLEAALRHLRHQNVPRRLWIDAICINQGDDIEKGYQIQQMQHVFRHARPVIVWLGEATADSDLALTFVRQIHDRFLSHTRRRFENEKMEDYPKLPEIKAKLRSFIKPKYILSWVALHSLFNRLWWSRAWIIQELLMAKQLQRREIQFMAHNQRYYICSHANWPLVHKVTIKSAAFTLSSTTAALVFGLESASQIEVRR